MKVMFQPYINVCHSGVSYFSCLIKYLKEKNTWHPSYLKFKTILMKILLNTWANLVYTSDQLISFQTWNACYLYLTP
jgi:hypothetical protein